MKSFSIQEFKSNCLALYERICGRIDICKKEIAVVLEKDDWNSAKKLANLTNTLGSLKEEQRWYEKYSKTHEHYNKERIYSFFIRDSLSDTDDKWSGRGNDFRRSCNDGKIEALKEINSLLEE